MSEIKKEKLNITKFNNLQKMFESSLDEDFFLALSMWAKHDISQSLNTIMGRRLSYKLDHGQMVLFKKAFLTFCYDTSIHKLLDYIKDEVGTKDLLVNQLLKEELLSTVQTMLSYHDLAENFKLTTKQILLYEECS
tara:strand:+ start:14 stop:421 length:408 start_codon:yes stop_codon:yes gene_type:complete